MSLFAELKRRRVLHAAGLYLVVAWAVIQVADVVTPHLGLPGWTVTFIIVVAALGLPIALVLSWVFDFTGAGLQRTSESNSQAQPVSGSRATVWIALALVVALVLFGAYWRLRARENRGGDYLNSVAVLPFVDMSPKKDQEYFGDGITEEILNVLAQLPGLRVPARTSSFSFKGKNLPISEVARQLNVANVLEGSIRKDGDQVRITAQLIDAKNDRHLWSETYDRNISDVFAVQDEIAHAIVDALQLHIKQTEADRKLVAKETASGRAHETYLKGLYYWHRRHVDELPVALELMRRATREDPRYARAWAGLALTYAVIPQYVLTYDRQLAIRDGKAAAARALELDPKSAEAHAALGQIAQELEWDWQAATSHLNRAVEIDPAYATAHQWRAELYLALGRYDDALAEIDRALEIDPISVVMENIRGYAYMLTGQSEQAITINRALIERDPGFQPARNFLVRLLWQAQRYDEALAVTQDSSIHIITRGLADPRQRPAAMRVLSDSAFRREHYIGLSVQAYMRLGEPDSAAALLNNAADEWAPALAYEARTPLWIPLRDKPQFKEFVRKLHLDK